MQPLHDFGKGKVIGVTTFGKGIMQNTQQLPNGGALTLTVAKYRTVRGECYHGVGITPDAEVKAGEEKGGLATIPTAKPIRSLQQQFRRFPNKQSE